MNELPILLIEPVADDIDQFVVEEFDDGNPAIANEQVNERNGNMILENPGLVINNVQENVIHDVEMAPEENSGSADDAIEVKQEPELIIMNEDDAAELDRILQDGDEDLDISNNLLNLSVENGSSATELTDLNDSGEVEFEQVDSFPEPMVCTEDVLSKFEDDSISFNLSYAPKVRFN